MRTLAVVLLGIAGCGVAPERVPGTYAAMDRAGEVIMLAKDGTFVHEAPSIAPERVNRGRWALKAQGPSNLVLENFVFFESLGREGAVTALVSIDRRLNGELRFCLGADDEQCFRKRD